MMIIKVNSIKYSGFDDNGNTTQVTVGYNSYDNSGNMFSANVILNNSDLTDGTTLDDLTRKQFDKLARQKIVNWVMPQPAKPITDNIKSNVTTAENKGGE